MERASQHGRPWPAAGTAVRVDLPGESAEQSPAHEAAEDPRTEAKNPFLVALGERVRGLRARRGMTRKSLAQAADISERHLANLEYGVGNASILILLQVAQALQCSVAELVGDPTTASPEWLMLRELLVGRDEATLHPARVAVSALLRSLPVGQRNRRMTVVTHVAQCR